VIAHEEMLASDKSINPGPLSRVVIMRDSGDGEELYEFLTPELCKRDGSVDGEVIVSAMLSSVAPGSKVELTLTSCDTQPAVAYNGEPEYMECICEGKAASSVGSVTLPAQAMVEHRFKLGALPCGVVARARARAGGAVVGELASYASAGSCPE
jgi:hypothetical protein